jgi:hypothetical protein
MSDLSPQSDPNRTFVWAALACRVSCAQGPVATLVDGVSDALAGDLPPDSADTRSQSTRASAAPSAQAGANTSIFLY